MWNVKFVVSAEVGPPKVLIETLWNVKETELAKLLGQYTVLIETLWNVKVLPLSACSGSTQY